MTQFSLIRLLCFAAVGLLATCRQPVPAGPGDVTAYFSPLPAVDTLLVEVTDSSDDSAVGDTIPNGVFFGSIPPALLEEIDYLADSSQALVLGRNHFAMSDDIEAYWVEIRQFWFRHHALLLYHKSRKAFTDRITLAEWYGGEGGQVLIGSWVFDFDGDGKKDILRRDIQHSMVPNSDTLQERTAESVSLLLWKNGQFTITPVRDTAALIRMFPIRTLW